jgi:hypothetical protein
MASLICKCVIADQIPWLVFCGVSRAAGVMSFQPRLQVGRKTDVTLVGFLFTLKEINVEHRAYPKGPPSPAASAGSLR